MKRNPLRMCLVCRNMLSKEKLVRVVKNNENIILIDKTGKMNGRGAYVCLEEDCLNKLKKQKVLNRAFKMEISEDIYDNLCEEIIERKN